MASESTVELLEMEQPIDGNETIVILNEDTGETENLLYQPRLIDHSDNHMLQKDFTLMNGEPNYPRSLESAAAKEESQNPPHLNTVEIIVRNHHNSISAGDDEDSDNEYLECLEEPFLEADFALGMGLDDRGDGDMASTSFNHRHFHRRMTPQDGDEMDEDDNDPDLEMEIEEDIMAACFPSLDSAKSSAGAFVRRVWQASWRVTHFHYLPEWLQDNDYLHTQHRPQLSSFGACFKSIFQLHTETGNIWTHMIGCVMFIGMAGWFMTRPSEQMQWEDKLIFAPFFLGAAVCLGLSFAFHTVQCHSQKVGKIFSKLDYMGISTLTVGSFIPWLYYGFYCSFYAKIIYCVLITLLGALCIVVSLWNRFSTPKYRPLRAGIFIALGLSGIIPCIHYLATKGFHSAIYEAALGWLLLMASLYIGGALLYALRVPERFFPGKCDLWFQSHQIFHVFVVAAAFVHYHGITEQAYHRLSGKPCPV